MEDHLTHFTTAYTYGSHLAQQAAAACDNCDFECLFENGLTLAQQCYIASTTCFSQGKFDQYNFFYLLFCVFDANIFIFLPLAFLLIYLIFGFVSATVEEYIAGGITYVSEALNLSEALAAVTLLAFANGAGDVITAIVASGSEGGVSYNIGALYGAGFFVCSMVICLTIMSSTDQIIVDKGTIFRDIGFYILSTIVTIFYAYQGTIYTWSAVLFLVIYVLMVLAVYIQDIIEQKERDKIEEQNARLEAEKYSISQKKNNPLGKLKEASTNVINKIKVAKIMNTIIAKKRLLKHATLHTDPDASGEEDDDEVNFWELNLFEKFMFFFEYPLDFLRKITMPPSEKEKYDKILCIIWPFPGILFIMYGFDCLTLSNYLTYGLPISFVLSLIFYKTQKDLDKEEVPGYFIWISLLSTIVGLVWTYIGCAMLIDLLNTFIIVFKLNQTYMGLTILGVGNALPDALTTVALAKKGYAQMGITGSYAGQLFGLLIGFGLAQLKTTLTDGPQDFSLFEQPVENLLDILVVGFSLLNLVATAIYGIVNKYHFGKGLAYLVGFLYVSFFIIASGIQIYYLMNGIL